MYHCFLLMQLCFSFVSSQWYDPWSVVNQLNLQNSLGAAEAYIQGIENQAINNSNTALKLVIAKATEAQQAILIARTLTVFTVEQRYLLNMGAYQASAEIEASRISVMKVIEALLLQSKSLAIMTRNSLMQIKGLGLWSQLAMPILRQDLQIYKSEMEKRAQDLNKALKIYNSNVEGSICRVQATKSEGKNCEPLLSIDLAPKTATSLNAPNSSSKALERIGGHSDKKQNSARAKPKF